MISSSEIIIYQNLMATSKLMLSGKIAQRASDPNEIHKELDLIIHEKNLRFINQLLSEYESPTIWAAWGTLIEKRPFLMNCIDEIYQLTLQYNCQWVSFGKKSSKV
jgi:hypothetical protein